MLHADSSRNRLIGIGLSSLAFVCFTVIDGTGKWLVMNAMPVFMVVWLRFVTHAVFATVLCFVASVYPAWRAAKLAPVESIRYE